MIIKVVYKASWLPPLVRCQGTGDREQVTGGGRRHVLSNGLKPDTDRCHGE